MSKRELIIELICNIKSVRSHTCRLMTFWCITPTLHTHWREFRKYLSSSHPPRDHRHSFLEKEWRGRWLETDLEDCWDIRTSHPAISNLLSCPGMFSRPGHLCGIKHSPVKQHMIEKFSQCYQKMSLCITTCLEHKTPPEVKYMIQVSASL